MAVGRDLRPAFSKSLERRKGGSEATPYPIQLLHSRLFSPDFLKCFHEGRERRSRSRFVEGVSHFAAVVACDR